MVPNAVCCSFIVSRGAAGPLLVPADLSGLVVGRTPHGLQVPVDAHRLRHLQLPAGKIMDFYLIKLFAYKHVFCYYINLHLFHF